MNRLFIVAACSVVVWFLPSHTAAEEPRTGFECRFVGTPIVIDGTADEPGWQHADVIDNFYLPWLQEDAHPAQAATQARLLWDRKFLYFFARMEDDDLFADITEHDGKTWDNDVFEMFFKPAKNKSGYFEFHVSAAGTVMDVFLPKRGDGKFKEHLVDGDFHIESSVVSNGTLNVRTDTDQGWAVEGRIPWHDFMKAGGRPVIDEEWTFALCRYDYSVNVVDPELSTCAPLKSLDHADFHHYEDFASLKFIGPQRRDLSAEVADVRSDRLMMMRQNWRNVESKITGSPEPPLPYVAQRAYPQLSLAAPIFAINEPGSRRLLFIQQGKVSVTGEDPSSGEFSALYEFPKGAIVYSIAFHPNYADNGYVYVGWNGKREGDGEKYSVITRLTLEQATQSVDPNSALDIISWASNGHNGAAPAFGLDGMLYVTSGDGTSDSDTNLTGQGMDHLLAKVLRIDVDHPDDDRPYSVPDDNPFVGQKDVRPETYAIGMRNPWRMTVDSKTGDIWVGNNGQDLWEQVYLVKPGDNFGWSVYEGSHVFYANRKLGSAPLTKPTLEHPHSEARSLTGGVVYYGERFPDLQGAYIYGDYSTGKIWGARIVEGQVAWHQELADTALQISAFVIDADGELVIVDHNAKEGGFYKLQPNDTELSPDDFPRKLSDSGFFTAIEGHQTHPGLIPYSVNSPLWSDGSFKSRHIYIPAETESNGESNPTQINFQTSSSWDFPDGTVAVKSFGLEDRVGDANSRRWIETRFLTRQQGEWGGYSYAWNADQTEAVLVEKEGRDAVFAVTDADGQQREHKWRFPSRTECMVCHSRAAKFVLGLSSMQLNREHDYGGVKANQLDVFEWLGLLNVNWKSDLETALKRELSVDEAAKVQAQLKVGGGQRSVANTTMLARAGKHYDRLAEPYDESADVTLRVRSYLHSNCAQCHVSAGGGNAEIQLDIATTPDKAKLMDVAPLHDKFGKPDARLVAPGSPERSILLHRLSIRGRGQMPQLATTIVDQRAVDLVTRWISELPQKEPSAPAASP